MWALLRVRGSKESWKKKWSPNPWFRREGKQILHLLLDGPKFDEYCEEIETIEPQKSELMDYLEKPPHKAGSKPNEYNYSKWWKNSSIAYLVLSKMAADILAVPMIIVASEATLGAETQVINSYQASLHPVTAQILLCGGDWCRSHHGIKKKLKVSFIILLLLLLVVFF